ncbi:hypothetical protein [Nonomuraea sp. NPDC052265]|uniref:hypothetical protein n=1 Tax=Nonomuraea sp. NPDC052265 TaxID=3364374 RepID=UPI0037CB16DC
MTITITEAAMTSRLTPVNAERVSAPGEPELWVVTGRRSALSRNQAITALTIAEYRATGRGASPHVAQWEQELLVPMMPTDPWALLQTLKAAARAVRGLPIRHAPPDNTNDMITYTAGLADMLRDVGEAVGHLSGFAGEVRDVAAAEAAGDHADTRHWDVVEVRAAAAADKLSHAGDLLHRTSSSAGNAQQEMLRRRDTHEGRR